MFLVLLFLHSTKPFQVSVEMLSTILRSNASALFRGNKALQFQLLRAATQSATAVSVPEKPYQWEYENDAALPNKWPAKACEFQNATVVQDGARPQGPQADYPDLKYHLPYDTGKFRLYCIPEAFFNFLHERTGVLGPYILLWGGLITLVSKEYLIFQEEFGAFLAWFVVPPVIATKLAPKIGKAFRTKYNDEMMVLDRLKESKIQQFSNEADALDQDAARADSGKEMFDVYSANAENMIEAEVRTRQEQVYEAFKRRLDYQVALQTLEEQVVQKQMVSWVKQEVDKSIRSQSQKEGINQCLKELKALAASNPSI